MTEVIYPAAAAAWLAKHERELPQDDDGRDSANVQCYATFYENDTRSLMDDRDDCDGVTFASENYREPEQRRDVGMLRDAEKQAAWESQSLDIPETPSDTDAKEDISSGTLGSGWRNVEMRLRYARESMAETIFHKPVEQLSPDEFLALERGVLKTGRPMRKAKKHQSRAPYTSSPLRTADADRAAMLDEETRGVVRATTQSATTAKVFLAHGWDVSVHPPRYIGHDAPEPATELQKPCVVAVPVPKNPYSVISLRAFDGIKQEFVEGLRLNIEDVEAVRSEWKNKEAKDSGMFAKVKKEIATGRFKIVRDNRNTTVALVPMTPASPPALRPHPFRAAPERIPCACDGCALDKARQEDALLSIKTSTHQPA